MKTIVFFFALSIYPLFVAQTSFPDFLAGTWQMENENTYEHWDLISEHNLRGFSYEMKNGRMQVSEYLELSRVKKKTVYSATVLGQNNRATIQFSMIPNDSCFVFVNNKHDFPKKIVYHKLSDSLLRVEISDGAEKKFSYQMHRLQETTISTDTNIQNPNYDPALALQLGGDDYGMKSYVLVVLKTGTNKTTDRDFINTCFRGHMDNISRLVDEQKLLVAGPLGKNNATYRGIFILNVTTFDEAKELLAKDLAITEGLLDYDLYNWYGSAALAKYLDYSDKIWKIKP